jgi:phosphoglycolate phosphatase-like HAD superfamily hydrolase
MLKCFLKKQLYAFDIDGTIFKGPPSFFNLLRYSLQKKSGQDLSSQIDPNPIPFLARKIDELDDYGVFPAYFIQTPKPKIQTLITKLSVSTNSKLVIVSGRGKKLLENITFSHSKNLIFAFFF